LSGAIVALALAGSAIAQAQEVIVAPPGPAYGYPAPALVAPAAPVVVAPPAPVVVAPPAPMAVVPAAPAYAYVGAPYAVAAVTVNPRTGRSCRIEPSGYHWCWTP
jgi:hypothetical protein